MIEPLLRVVTLPCVRDRAFCHAEVDYIIINDVSAAALYCYKLFYIISIIITVLSLSLMFNNT